MTETSETTDPFVGRIVVDGRSYAIAIQIAFDGVEHMGRLRFSDEDWGQDEGVVDPVAIAGASPNAILACACALTTEQLAQRFERARQVTRRIHGLRRTAEEALASLRHLRHVTTSLRAGLLDVDDAAREIDATEGQLSDMLRQLGAIGSRAA
jgi:hypothetical protein